MRGRGNRDPDGYERRRRRGLRERSPRPTRPPPAVPTPPARVDSGRAFPITYLAHNVVGNHREDYLSVVTDGTSSAIKTRLSWVEDVSIAQVGNASSDRQGDISP